MILFVGGPKHGRVQDRRAGGANYAPRGINGREIMVMVPNDWTAGHMVNMLKDALAVAWFKGRFDQ